MARTDRSEILIVTHNDQHLKVQNVRDWYMWGQSLETETLEEEKTFTASNFQRLLDSGYTYLWTADSNYSPLKTAFRRVLANAAHEDSDYSIFKAGRPTFHRSFDYDKFTSFSDYHDMFGGLRRWDLKKTVEKIDSLLMDLGSDDVEVNYVDFVASRFTFPHAVFQLSTNEPDSVIQRNHQSVSRIYPEVMAVNLHDSTILQSHAHLSTLSPTPNFFVFDADCQITQDLMSVTLVPFDIDSVHVWHVENPINGLVYGHGGPKAFHTDAFKGLTQDTVDVTTSCNQKNLVVHEVCVGVHRFNWSAESTWRTAFREAAKLYWIMDWDEAAGPRLEVWCNEYNPDEKFAEYCIHGANRGREWAESITNPTQLCRVNDFKWLGEMFHQLEPGQVLKEVEEMPDWEPSEDA